MQTNDRLSEGLNMAEQQEVKKKRFRPDGYVILFFVLLFAALLTYIIPAGSFDRITNDDGISLVVPGSYERVAQQPTGFLDIFVAIQEGLIASSGMIFLVIIIGGTFAVIEKTGAFDAIIFKTIQKTKHREWILIVFVAGVLSVFGGLGIISISVIALIPIGLLLAKAMKMDAIVGVAIMYLGAYSGFAIGFMDPVRTQLAQRIAELPIYSGVGYRLIIYFVITLTTILYIIWYANKVKKDPQKSLLENTPFPKEVGSNRNFEEGEFTVSQKLTLLVFLIGIGTYVYGVFQHGWSTNEMVGIFIMIAIATAIVSKMGANEFVSVFIEGCKSIFYGAFIIGLARSIVIVLQDGMVLDTIVYWIYLLIEPLSKYTGAVILLIVNGLFNFVVSSGTAHASIMMPIMTPLVDLMGIPRQIAVQAYTMGDGFTNIINPLSGTLLAILAISGISYSKWLRFALPLVLMWFGFGIIFMIIAVYIGWGPM